MRTLEEKEERHNGREEVGLIKENASARVQQKAGIVCVKLGLSPYSQADSVSPNSVHALRDA